jgi:hypothetical protein
MGAQTMSKATEIIERYIAEEQRELDAVERMYERRETRSQLDSRERPRRYRIDLLKKIRDEIEKAEARP